EAYTEGLRCAGGPRRPGVGSGLSLPFLLGMPLSMTPGSSIIASPELRCRHRLRRDLNSSALPILPQSVSRGARISGLPDSRICYGLPSCSPPLYGSDRCAQPPRALAAARDRAVEMPQQREAPSIMRPPTVLQRSRLAGRLSAKRCLSVCRGFHKQTISEPEVR